MRRSSKLFLPSQLARIDLRKGQVVGDVNWNRIQEFASRGGTGQSSKRRPIVRSPWRTKVYQDSHDALWFGTVGRDFLLCEKWNNSTLCVCMWLPGEGMWPTLYTSQTTSPYPRFVCPLISGHSSIDRILTNFLPEKKEFNDPTLTLSFICTTFFTPRRIHPCWCVAGLTIHLRESREYRLFSPRP